MLAKWHYCCSQLRHDRVFTCENVVESTFSITRRPFRYYLGTLLILYLPSGNVQLKPRSLIANRQENPKGNPTRTLNFVFYVTLTYVIRIDLLYLPPAYNRSTLPFTLPTNTFYGIVIYPHTTPSRNKWTCTWYILIFNPKCLPTSEQSGTLYICRVSRVQVPSPSNGCAPPLRMGQRCWSSLRRTRRRRWTIEKKSQSQNGLDSAFKREKAPFLTLQW